MRFSNKIFIVVVIFALLICMVVSIISPININIYENRYAQKMTIPKFEEIMNNEYQNKVESVFADQIPFASKFKKLYNLADSFFITSIVNIYGEAKPNNYIKFKNINLFGPNQLVYDPIQLNDVKSNLDVKIRNLNYVFNSNPNIDFYVYFIEKDTDIDFETNKKQGLKEYVFEQLQLPKSKEISFDINNIKDFKNYFYSTDHHWNYKGSYKAYCDLIKAIKPNDKLVEFKKEVLISQEFSGSKNSSLGYNFFREDFYAYEFEYRNMSILVNGKQVSDYGNQNEFISDIRNDISYGGFYGGDEGEIIFDTGASNKDNILIVGESFDNAILKLMASHFNKTYSIDLRYYESVFKEPFDIQLYMRKHNIKKVLLIGNVNYFSSADFILE